MGTKTEIFLIWLASAAAALTMIGGRMGLYLFGLAKDPPVDPEALDLWRRRRRWLAYSELSALPACATVALTATVYLDLPPITSVVISMVLGAVGFAFLLNGVQFVVRRRLGMPDD
ncbi:MAG: hypothetical protein AB7E05_14275 [Sphingobium sp.]